jgi:DNA-binding MarR family transcriptional regulator
LTVKSNASAPPRNGIGPPLIGALLRMPLHVVRERMLEGLHAHGFDDLRLAHLNVLQYPGPDDVRPSDLAAQTRMSKQALNYLLGQLVAMGYLTRQDDPGDNRSRRVHLTDRGREVIRVIRDTVAELEGEWARQLGEARFAQLRDLLAELSAAASG